MKNIKMVVLTCDQRKESLDTTLQSIEQSDWPTSPEIKTDSQYTSALDPAHRVDEAFRGILEEFVDGDCEHLLYLEDDVIVNKYLYHNLTSFGYVDYLTLCNWGDDRTGGQGILLSKKAARVVLDEQWRAPFDQMIRSILSDRGIKLHFYKPSLVQHNISNPSLIDAVTAQSYAIDFDLEYKNLSL